MEWICQINHEGKLLPNHFGNQVNALGLELQRTYLAESSRPTSHSDREWNGTGAGHLMINSPTVPSSFLGMGQNIFHCCREIWNFEKFASTELEKNKMHASLLFSVLFLSLWNMKLNATLEIYHACHAQRNPFLTLLILKTFILKTEPVAEEWYLAWFNHKLSCWD